jgi:hypothetical protein
MSKKTKSELDKELGELIFAALRDANSRAYLSGEPSGPIAGNRVSIDGEFNIRLVGRTVRRAVEKHRLFEP